MGNILEKLAKVVEDGSTEADSEFVEAIQKTAGEKVGEYNEINEIYDGLVKNAHEVIEGMSTEELEKFAAPYITYGKGFADAEVMFKEANLDEFTDIFFTKIAEVFGEEDAVKIYNGLLKEGEEAIAALPKTEEAPEGLKEVAEVAAEAAAEKMVEQAGGEEEVKKNPEVAKQIMEQAVQIGNDVAQEVAAATKEKPAE